jgi:hypothetical protein
MKVEVDGPHEIAERSDSMNPPTSTHKPKVTSPSSFLTAKQQLSEGGGKRRQSRFDPMDSDAEDEGYGESGHRHPFRKITEDEKKDTFTLPGIKSLLNPSNGMFNLTWTSPFGRWKTNNQTASTMAHHPHQHPYPAFNHHFPPSSPIHPAALPRQSDLRATRPLRPVRP